MADSRTAQAADLMRAFAADTGLIGDRPPRRYLWTDAHAVCNWLALSDRLADSECQNLALALVAQVHEVLGQHRPDDVRSGWISGLDDAEARLHPTAGGLRIGKPRPERRPGDPPDERAEWDQDGQYYHYLTRWMYALYKVARATEDDQYLRWAIELALTAQRRFRAPSGPPRLFWKMSIDLSYPLVASSGQHDPVDGLTTCLVLNSSKPDPRLNDVIADLKSMCAPQSLLTDDPLGLGGLLSDAARLAQLPGGDADDFTAGLLVELLLNAAQGVRSYHRSRALQLPAAHRLAFRELGLSIGLQAYDRIRVSAVQENVLKALDAIRPFLGLQASIETFWLNPMNQKAQTWAEHKDINSVMLASSLLADDFLAL